MRAYKYSDQVKFQGSSKAQMLSSCVEDSSIIRFSRSHAIARFPELFQAATPFYFFTVFIVN